MSEAKKPSDYKHIMAWGIMLGSHMYYIEGKQQEAFDDGAPIDAIYKRHGTEEWARIGGCVESTRKRVEAIVESIK